jgi:hypothetical protein
MGKDEKLKVHTIYRDADGFRVPSVTTIIGVLGFNTQILMHWAVAESLAGRDPFAVRDRAADIGTIAHGMIEADIKGEKFDTSEYAPNDVEKASKAYKSFLDWQDKLGIECIASELQLVHQRLKYGGTIDLVARHDTELWLVDFKTSKAVYTEHKIQVAAYRELYNANNKDQIYECHILRLPKDGGSYEHHWISENELDVAFDIFEHCKHIYDLNKQMRSSE